ncbi:putative U-box domain-containing protein kinase family protein [Hibiscus syriacus]|uniref:RING-type E3 ubiquitin transferase n=1 Tax=Hibiscus syriacus TaxID=106335 RepID=A0A6A2X9B6_HIBSY|nr:U-box domain-containing protein 33-like [Hibiscus syriacus]KAE8665810.1 putative U-box domain-containing protein kinase family protein [Hibiscus syriacus]
MDRTHNSDETIYVAVGKTVEESKHILSWALNNLCPAKIRVLHVHQPASFINLSLNMSRTSFSSRLQPQEYGNKILDRVMDDYLLICEQRSVHATKLNIEMDNAAKGIVELIRDYNIKKLVMGAAANKHFSEGMTDLKSEKAQYVDLNAPTSCKIWFICAGQLVRTRSLVETGKSHLSDPSSSSSYSTFSGKVTSNSDLSASETPGDSPDWLEFHEGSSDDDKHFDKLEQALVVIAENSNQEALDELDRRMKADKDALKAVIRQVSEMKSSYVRELIRRKETKATLRKQNEDLEQIKQQRDEARNIARTQKLLLDNQGANSDRVEVLEAKVSSAVDQLKVCERERDALQIKLENACKLIEDHFMKQEEDTSNVHMQQFFSEFSVAEIHGATEDFDPSFKIAEGAYGSIYKCTLRHTEVAIKVLHRNSLQGPLEFQQEVDILSKLRHPNLVTLIGVCPEIWALIYEYLPNGSLEDRLSRKDNTPPLSWQTRIHIATEICAALVFLHSSKPQRLVHGNLKPGNILLDTNFGCKLSDFGVCRALSSLENSSDTTNISRRFPYLDPQFCSTRTLTPSSDRYPFGLILLQLITGKPPVLLAEKVQSAINGQYLIDLLDPSAGGWPYVQAEQLTRWALGCCDPNQSRRPDLEDFYKILEQIRNDIGPLTTFHAGSNEHNQPPHYFICPISQEVMAEPYVAADGYTYELRDLRRWLDSGHNTSPVIGNQLPHLTLNPNYVLRSAILEWRQQQQQQQQQR